MDGDDRSLNFEDPQREWLMLSRCLNAQPTHLLRTVPPHNAMAMAQAHDKIVLEVLQHIMPQLPLDDEPTLAQVTAPIASGGLGLTSATSLADAAYFASVTDSLESIHRRLGLQGLGHLNYHFPLHVQDYVATQQRLVNALGHLDIPGLKRLLV